MRRVLSWVLVPLFCLAAFFVIHRYHQSQKPQPVAYTPTTWSEFSEYRRLEMLLQGFSIQSMVDLPACDVLELQKHPLGIKTYLGIAESPLLARALQAQFGSLQKTFSHFRIDADVLPQVDLILAWDKLCNLPDVEVRATLLQFKKSGAKFLLMRHYPQIEKNTENTTGAFQPVNWNLPPYNFPEPIIHIMEEVEGGYQSLALWSFDKL